MFGAPILKPILDSPTEVKETVMAKVIEFYLAKNFRKASMTVAQPQLGKIIELCPAEDEISLAEVHLLRIQRKYDVHSRAKRLYASGRFRKTATSNLPKLSQPGAVPFRATPGNRKEFAKHYK